MPTIIWRWLGSRSAPSRIGQPPGPSGQSAITGCGSMMPHESGGIMTPARRRQVEEIYHAASQREESQREAFLSEACEGDEELKSEVESLLRQESSGDGLLAWGDVPR